VTFFPGLGGVERSAGIVSLRLATTKITKNSYHGGNEDTETLIAETAEHALRDDDSTRRREAAATGRPGPAPPAGRVEFTLCVLRSSVVEISAVRATQVSAVD